jgi:hypothetical protein
VGGVGPLTASSCIARPFARSSFAKRRAHRSHSARESCSCRSNSKPACIASALLSALLRAAHDASHKGLTMGMGIGMGMAMGMAMVRVYDAAAARCPPVPAAP